MPEQIYGEHTKHTPMIRWASSRAPTIVTCFWASLPVRTIVTCFWTSLPERTSSALGYFPASGVSNKTWLSHHSDCRIIWYHTLVEFHLFLTPLVYGWWCDSHSVWSCSAALCNSDDTEMAIDSQVNYLGLLHQINIQWSGRPRVHLNHTVRLVAVFWLWRWGRERNYIRKWCRRLL